MLSHHRRTVAFLALASAAVAACGKNSIKTQQVSRRSGSDATLNTNAKDIHSGPGKIRTEDLITNIPTEAECTGKGLLPARLWRLTDIQYINSVEDIFGAAVSAGLPELNEDRGKGTFASDASSIVVSTANFGKLYTAGESFSSKAVASGPADLKACRAASSDACIRDAIASYGRRMWRRALTTQETDKLHTLAKGLKSQGASQEEALRAALEGLFQSPNFWYRSEVGQPVAGMTGRRKLSSYEVATLLSYTLWAGPPDTVLLDAAAANRLESEADVQSQIVRMTSDAKFERGLRQLFDEWLNLRAVGWIEKDQQTFGSVFTDALRKDMRQESVTFIRDYVHKENPAIEGVFKSNFSYLNGNLSSFYKAPGGSGASFARVQMPAAERLGILTQGAFLAGFSKAKGTGIPHRADVFLNDIVCTPMKPPPPGIADMAAADTSTKMTTRQKYEKLHSVSAACASCHKVLDPIGGAFENFDSIGRYRSTEFDLPVDSSGKLDDESLGDARATYANGLELLEHVAGSQKFSQCFTIKTFQAFGGMPSTKQMDCEVAALDSKLKASNYKALSSLQSISSLKSLFYRDEVK